MAPTSFVINSALVMAFAFTTGVTATNLPPKHGVLHPISYSSAINTTSSSVSSTVSTVSTSCSSAISTIPTTHSRTVSTHSASCSSTVSAHSSRCSSTVSTGPTTHSSTVSTHLTRCSSTVSTVPTTHSSNVSTHSKRCSSTVSTHSTRSSTGSTVSTSSSSAVNTTLWAYDSAPAPAPTTQGAAWTGKLPTEKLPYHSPRPTSTTQGSMFSKMVPHHYYDPGPMPHENPNTDKPSDDGVRYHHYQPGPVTVDGLKNDKPSNEPPGESDTEESIWPAMAPHHYTPPAADSWYHPEEDKPFYKSPGEFDNSFGERPPEGDKQFYEPPIEFDPTVVQFNPSSLEQRPTHDKRFPPWRLTLSHKSSLSTSTPCTSVSTRTSTQTINPSTVAKTSAWVPNRSMFDSKNPRLPLDKRDKVPHATYFRPPKPEHKTYGTMWERTITASTRTSASSTTATTCPCRDQHESSWSSAPSNSTPTRISTIISTRTHVSSPKPTSFHYDTITVIPSTTQYMTSTSAPTMITSRAVGHPIHTNRLLSKLAERLSKSSKPVPYITTGLRLPPQARYSNLPAKRNDQPSNDETQQDAHANLEERALLPLVPIFSSSGSRKPCVSKDGSKCGSTATSAGYREIPAIGTVAVVAIVAILFIAVLL